MLQSSRLYLLSFIFRLVQSLLLLFGKLTESAGTFLYKTIVMPRPGKHQARRNAYYICQKWRQFSTKKSGFPEEPDFTKKYKFIMPCG